MLERKFKFPVQFKLVINTNHRPQIQDDTLFESERIVAIPFDRHFTPEDFRRNVEKIALYLEEKMERIGRNSAAVTVYRGVRNLVRGKRLRTESKHSFSDELRNKGIFRESGKVNGVTTHNIVKNTN